MPVTKATVRKLATQSEWQLLVPSFGSAIKDITAGRLKQKITRARKLQDKYRDLARQQQGEARGKRRAKSTRAAEGNANTLAKQELFTEALGRFEAQLAKLTARAEREAARGAKAASRTASGKQSIARKATRSPRASGVQPETAMTDDASSPWSEAALARATSRQTVSANSRGPRKAAALTRQSGAAHHGHVGSRGRRNQARRDSK